MRNLKSRGQTSGNLTDPGGPACIHASAEPTTPAATSLNTLYDIAQIFATDAAPSVGRSFNSRGFSNPRILA